MRGGLCGAVCGGLGGGLRGGLGGEAIGVLCCSTGGVGAALGADLVLRLGVGWLSWLSTGGPITWMHPTKTVYSQRESHGPAHIMRNVDYHVYNTRKRCEADLVTCGLGRLGGGLGGDGTDEHDDEGGEGGETSSSSSEP